MRTVLNRITVVASALAALVLVMGSEDRALAAKSADDCNIDLRVCQQIGCKNEGEWCFKDCEKVFMRCGGKGGGKNQQTQPGPITPKGGQTHTPPIGGTKDEPKPLPPRVNDPRAPTTGTNSGPKIPPKVNDTRPPMGGGIFQPKTSGSGNSGPILLRSGGAPAPIQKSGGGNGSNSKSGGRN